MTSNEIAAALYRMTSGECRWVGREDVHVYCWAPCDLVLMPHGRHGWQRRQPVFKAWTSDSVGSPWDDAGWVTAAVVVRQIESILTEEPRHVA